MRSSLALLAPIAFSATLIGACGGGSSDGSLSDLAKGKGQVRTISGTLSGATGEVGVGVKTDDGKEVIANIDPKTNRFSASIPKGQSAVLSIKAGGQMKRVKFPRKPAGKTDEASDFSSLIPADAFEKTAHLGTIDISGEGEEIIVGDDEGEESIWAFVDEDDDGIVDWEDPDAEFDATEDDWISEEDDAWWDLFEEVSLCDLESEAECEGNAFDEDLCAEGGEEAELWCSYEGEEDYTVPCWDTLIDLEDPGETCDAPCNPIPESEQACWEECWIDFCLE
jgi:hypothetical protein